MEVLDLLKLRSKRHILSLDDSSYSISSVVSTELQDCFLKGVPFPYLLGEAEFYGHKFFVSPDVLIPRPETEQLVDLIVNSRKKYQHVLDVGTGSGVILLSLLDQNVAKMGLGLDLSVAALKVAQVNRERLRLEQRCEFRLSDRLEKASGQFDLIVSNPPYIKEKTHRALVHESVDQFEPKMALYLPDEDYQTWFREFFMEVKKHLLAGGLFMMEGHELELKDQAQMLRTVGFNQVKLIQDFSGRDRFLEAIS